MELSTMEWDTGSQTKECGLRARCQDNVRQPLYFMRVSSNVFRCFHSPGCLVFVWPQTPQPELSSCGSLFSLLLLCKLWLMETPTPPPTPIECHFCVTFVINLNCFLIFPVRYFRNNCFVSYKKPSHRFAIVIAFHDLS